MRDILEERQHGIKIFSEHQNLNENVSWQDDVYKVWLLFFLRFFYVKHATKDSSQERARAFCLLLP